MARGVMPAQCLSYTLSSPFEPGSNLRARAAGAAWIFLLPRLELGSVLCAGAPPPASLAALARPASDVTVACLGPLELRRGLRAAREIGAHVDVISLSGRLPRPDGGADLLVVSRRAAARLRRQPGLVAELRRVLAPDGAVFVDADEPPAGLGQPRWLRLWPRRGEARAVASEPPDGDGGPPRGRPGRGARRAVLALSRGTANVPDYVRQLAEEAGLDTARMHVGLSAPGEYASRKVILFLFDAEGGPPHAVVKATRDPALNGRLENEWRALRTLAGLEIDVVTPRPLFFGRPGGLAVLGQSAIAGEPYRSRFAGEPGARLLADAVGSLRDLARATAHPVPASEAAGALGRIAGRFVELYRPDARLRGFLEAQVEAVRASPAPFPLVLQHGDPGTWNLLATPEGRVAFLDWESAEPDGVPLWDLFYLFRSHGVSLRRAAGERNSLAAFELEFVRGGGLGTALAEAVAAQRATIGLDADLVEPLFHLCWAHRALKEATRLPPQRLGRGHYVRLLRLCAGRREASGLQRVLTA